MKLLGLMRKDIYELWAQARVQIGLTVLYLFLPLLIPSANLLAGVGMMLLAMLPVYTLGYDERCRWERYALAMPLRKRDLFWSRFLLGAAAVLLGGAVEAVVALLAGRNDLLSSLLITVPSALAYLLVTLPLMMKLGVEKGRFILLLLTLAFLLAPELIQ